MAKNMTQQAKTKGSAGSVFYFAIKVVPVNAKSGHVPQLVTKHRRQALAEKAAAYEVVVERNPAWQQGHAVRFEIVDMNSDLDSPAGAKSYLESDDGRAWIDGSIDHAVFKLSIE